MFIYVSFLYVCVCVCVRLNWPCGKVLGKRIIKSMVERFLPSVRGFGCGYFQELGRKMTIKTSLASSLALPAYPLFLPGLLPGWKKGKLVIWEWFSTFYLFDWLLVAEVLANAYHEQVNWQCRHRLYQASAGRTSPVFSGNLALTASTFPGCTCSYFYSGDVTKMGAWTQFIT